MSSEKKKLRTQQAMTGQHDELTLENSIRRKYAANWPSVIRECTKRIQAVNNTWQKIIQQVMQIDGLRISYAREGDMLVIAVSISQHPKGGVAVEEVELHEVPVQEVAAAGQYLEVLVMDKLSNSELIARYAR